MVPQAQRGDADREVSQHSVERLVCVYSLCSERQVQIKRIQSLIRRILHGFFSQCSFHLYYK